jgi:hypothetical protein
LGSSDIRFGEDSAVVVWVFGSVLGLRLLLLLRTSPAKKVKMTCAGWGNKVPRPENPHLILEVILSNPTLTFRFESSKF